MDIEKLQAELDEEAELWEQAGLSVDNTSHSNGSIFIMKQQIQAIINVLLTNKLVGEEEINIEFKTLLLNSLRELREMFGPAMEQARISELMGRPQKITLPEHKLLGSDGKELKI